uniref:Ovule protein n=1 Tax=Steinernema glaseri TaxID=37863 RepID=A0A1I7Z8P5_9BILA
MLISRKAMLKEKTGKLEAQCVRYKDHPHWSPPSADYLWRSNDNAQSTSAIHIDLFLFHPSQPLQPTQAMA